MNNEKFMDQKMCDMTVKELAKAIVIKTKQKGKVEGDLTFSQEIKKYPGRFERLTQDGWKVVNRGNGVSKGPTEVLNTNWNYYQLNNKVFYVKFEGYYKEIVRRR